MFFYVVWKQKFNYLCFRFVFMYIMHIVNIVVEIDVFILVKSLLLCINSVFIICNYFIITLTLNKINCTRCEKY
jgi:hypothetical protein